VDGSPRKTQALEIARRIEQAEVWLQTALRDDATQLIGATLAERDVCMVEGQL